MNRFLKPSLYLLSALLTVLPGCLSSEKKSQETAAEVPSAPQVPPIMAEGDILSGFTTTTGAWAKHKTVVTTASGDTTTIEGYLDVGILDTMKDLLVNLIGAVVFSTIGYISLKKAKTSKVAESLMIRPNEKEEEDNGD